MALTKSRGKPNSLLFWADIYNKLYVYSESALFYIDNADKDLLIFALHNYNENFLKFSFRNNIFGSNLLTQEDIIE